MRLQYCLYIILVFSAFNHRVVYSKTVEEAFEEGNQTYAHAEMLLKDNEDTKAAEHFQKALKLYKTCLEKAESAALHFNLGNTYFKLGLPGYSIFHFKQALLLKPDSEETRANLRLVEKYVGLEKTQENLLDQTLGSKTPQFWKWFLWGSLWFGICLLALPRYFGILTPILPIIGSVCILLCSVPIFAILKAGEQKNLGIVLESDTPVLVSPTNQSAVAHYLQPGNSINIKEDEENKTYFFVETNRGESGWVAIENIGRLHP